VIGVLLAAGLIARWITQRARPGVLAPSDRLGIIHFGSRSVLYLPQDRYRVTAAPPGRRAHAGRPQAMKLPLTNPRISRTNGNWSGRQPWPGVPRDRPGRLTPNLGAACRRAGPS
jgi:hypothetical protein